MSQNPKDTETLARLRNYMHMMKGYGQLVIELARQSKSSTRTVYRWLKGKNIPSKRKVALIKKWLDSRA